MDRWEAHERLRRVRDELDVARFTIRFALDRWDAPDGASGHAADRGIAHAQLLRLRDDVEATFVTRLIAEFEGVLKDYRENGLKKRPARINLYDLMEQVARKRRMDEETLTEAHEVRDDRNDIVHRNLRTPRIDFATGARRLGKFLAWLPDDW